MRSETSDLAAVRVAATHSAVTRRDAPVLARALSAVLASWLAQTAARVVLEPALGVEVALAAAGLAALVPALWIARALDLRRAGPELEPCALGLMLGFLLLPLMLVPLAEVGTALAPREAPQPSALAAPGAVSLVAVLVAPVSEELLFRRLLLPALAERLGAAAALCAVTALYAACHAGAGPMLVAAATGALFGAVMLASGSLALCIGLHAGLNLAALAGGVPAFQDPLPLLALPPAFAPALLAGGLALWRGGAALRVA